MEKLRVRPCGGLVYDYAALLNPTSPVRRSVSHKIVEKDGQVVFERITEPVELPNTPEYRRHVADGDFEPLDEATAALCNVPFKAAPKAAAQKG